MASSINESQQALKRLLSIQLQKDWKVIRKNIIKNEQEYFQKYPSYIPEEVSLSQISTRPNKIYEYFAEHINKQVVKKDKDLRGAVGSANLKDFHKKRTRPNTKSRGQTKRSYFLEGIAIYCGFVNYNHFLEKYHGFISFVNRLENLYKSFEDYHQEEKDYLQSHKKSIEEFLDAGDLAKYNEIVHLKQDLQTKTHLQDMKMYELLEFLSANQTHFINLYQAIVKYNDEFEIIEKKQYQKLRNRRIGLASVVLFILVTSSFSISQLLKPKVLTQADFDKIEIEILEIDQAPEGHATVRFMYDASHLGKSLEGLDIYYQGTAKSMKQKLSKSIDTLTIMYNRAGVNHVAIMQGQIYKRKRFILSSKDWVSFATNDKDWDSKMFQKKDMMKNRLLTFPREAIPIEHKNYFYTSYVYPKEIKVSFNDFSIEVKAKLEKDVFLDATCYESTFKLFNTKINEEIMFSMLNQGCTRWSNIYFGSRKSKNHFLDRTKVDLEVLKKFTVPLSELYDWHTLKVKVKNQKITYFFNGKEIYAHTIDKLSGNLASISQNFKGLGMIDYVKVWNGKGELTYQEEFEEAL